ncbi:hypothetical protein MMC21_000225 [Puttea exsequens]|nr:hypothetical protein [Puttea exsequens]
MLPLRWKEDSSIKISQLVWREDMHILVLEILRKNVTDMLTYLVSRRAAYITPCNTAERISNHKQISAVLWLGPTRAASSSENSSGNEAIQTLSNSLQGTPVYTMHRCKSRYVPLYDLHSLLGAGHVRRMREDRPFHFGSEYAVLKEKRPTLAAQMELWKLMGYLAQDLQEDGGHEAIRVLGA